MNEHLDHDDAVVRSERELTLSTGAILGIFFGLVVLCGLCYGVGYNMGRKSTPTPLAINDTNSDVPTSTSNATKPSAGSPFEGASTADAAPAVVASAPAPAPKPAIVRKPVPVAPAEAAATTATAPPVPASTATREAEKPPAAPIVRTVPPNALMPGASVPGTGSVMVQVAAVSHQEDADLLVGALRSRGYAVSARPAASDGFIHVQIGPFSDKKTAEAMKQRLLSDGYNAILK